MEVDKAPFTPSLCRCSVLRVHAFKARATRIRRCGYQGLNWGPLAPKAAHYLKAGFHMIADDRRRSRIADDRKESCFHIIADDRKAGCSHTFRSAEMSNVHARCARGKILANNIADIEVEILRKQIYFFF